MDFDLLDLREASGKQYWVQLRVADTLLFADMDAQERPCRVLVASGAEKGVEEATKAVTRVGKLYAGVESQLANANREQRTGLEKRLDALDREAEKCLTGFLTTAIKDWENIEKAGAPLPFSADALADMAQPKAPLFRMAGAIVQDSMAAQSPFAEAATG